MNLTHSVNDLSYRFKEMSVNRDHVLQENGKWPLTGNRTSLTFFDRPSNFQKGAMQNFHRVFWRGSGLDRNASLTRSLDNVHRSESFYDKGYFSLPNKRCGLLSEECGDNDSRTNKLNDKSRCHWIKNSTDEVESDFRRVCVQWHNKPQSMWSFAACQPTPKVRPSSFFFQLVKAVAESRGVRSPPIPQEVIIAYENYVRGGTSMLKFVRYSAPHKRFFLLSFFKKNDNALPVAALCWYKDQESGIMKRYLPLAHLLKVVSGGEGNPMIQRRKTKSGLIKGSPVNMDVKYLRADFILQWYFGSSSDGKEVLAVILPDRHSFLAWYIVSDFFSRIGTFS